MKKKDVDVEEIIRLRNAGMKMKDIVAGTGLSESTIYARLRETGHVCGRRKERFAPTLEEAQDIISAYKAGYSSTYLGKRYGVSPGTILRFLRENKVWIRPSIAVILHMYERPQEPHRRRKLHGPKKSPTGYTVVYAPGHPRANRNGYVWEHVLVMEKELGRYLGTDEIVHHIDRDKSNNDPGNLLVLTKSQHAALHYAEKRDRMRYHAPPKIRGELEALALELHKAGKTDPQIAAAIGVCTGTVLKWRRRNGIGGNAKPKFDRDRAMDLYRNGWIDAAIAAELGVSKLTVLRWRQTNGLERVSRSKVAGLAVQRLYDMGMTDGQIAQRLNVTHQNVAYWRSKNGLQSNYKPPRKLTDEAIEAILTAEEKTKTLAERYGVSQETIRAVRRGERIAKNENGNDEERTA